MLGVHLALTGAPGIAAALVAMRLGVRDVPVLLGIALAASGAAAFLAFWAYFADPTIGQAWNYVLLLGSIQVAVLAVYRGNLDRDLLRQLRIPLLLWILGSVFIVYLGFLHGGDRKRDRDVGRSPLTPACCPPTTTSPATSPNGSRPKATTGLRPSTRPTG